MEHKERKKAYVKKAITLKILGREYPLKVISSVVFSVCVWIFVFLVRRQTSIELILPLLLSTIFALLGIVMREILLRKLQKLMQMKSKKGIRATSEKEISITDYLHDKAMNKVGIVLILLIVPNVYIYYKVGVNNEISFYLLLCFIMFSAIHIKYMITYFRISKGYYCNNKTETQELLKEIIEIKENKNKTSGGRKVVNFPEVQKVLYELEEMAMGGEIIIK